MGCILAVSYFCRIGIPVVYSFRYYEAKFQSQSSLTWKKSLYLCAIASIFLIVCRIIEFGLRYVVDQQRIIEEVEELQWEHMWWSWEYYRDCDACVWLMYFVGIEMDLARIFRWYRIFPDNKLLNIVTECSLYYLAFFILVRLRHMGVWGRMKRCLSRRMRNCGDASKNS